ncbi:low molecular weight phosphotyrosine protein phosphatase [Aggregicoccus sp. 17bor-14]|nr:low molecular weight phosphotyrosine protein phosphatase [Simulacricoccus sp. 17bor-14]MRI88539.1 low molecular weight phosphotyrosine protein phosphatase [Aggregicoccus sp. 17bor-14]
MFNRILLVCVGNICRSPMAAALAASRWSSLQPSLVVESAGVSALVGSPADPLAQELMLERGIDISDHRARQLTAQMAHDFELILVMEGGHQRAVESLAPSARGRVFPLGKWGRFDVPDPYRRPREAFVEALELIERGLVDVEKRMGLAR